MFSKRNQSNLDYTGCSQYSLTAGPQSSFQEQDNMGGHQSSRGLPALWGQTSCQQQRNC